MQPVGGATLIIVVGDDSDGLYRMAENAIEVERARTIESLHWVGLSIMLTPYEYAMLIESLM